MNLQIKSSEATQVPVGEGVVFDIAKDRLVSTKYLLKLMGISRSTFDRWVKDGKFPQPHFTFGLHTHRWILRSVAEFIVLNPNKT